MSPVSLRLKVDKDIARKESCRAIPLVNIKAKFSQQHTSRLNPARYSKNCDQDQEGFVQMHMSNQQSTHKTHTIISVHTEKSQHHLFMMKTWNNSEVWWCTPVVPALRRHRQEDCCKFTAILVYSACLRAA